jgi:uncharacterized membrane protein (DUF485 family)
VYIYIYSINQKNKSKFPKSIFSKNLKLFSRNLSQSQQFMSKFHHLKLKTRGWAERSTSCRERECGRTTAGGGEWCGGRLVDAEKRREKVRTRTDWEKVKVSPFFFPFALYFFIFFFLFPTLYYWVNHQIGPWLCNSLSNWSLILSISQISPRFYLTFLKLVHPLTSICWLC